MKLSMDYLDLWFRDVIFYHAKRCETGIWDADDIAQDVLIHLSRQNWPNRPTPSKHHDGRTCKTPPSRIIRAIRNRAMNIRRDETIRLKCGEPSRLIPGRRPSPTVVLAIKEAILTLSSRQARVVRARVFPEIASEATMRQVALETGYSLATVSRTLADARELLETALLEERQAKRLTKP